MKKQLLLSAIAGILAFPVSSCQKKKCGGHQKSDCICTMEYAPVCGSDNKTYGNACEAGCNGITTYTPGECAGP